MKKRYIGYTTATFLLGVAIFASCKKSFLETLPAGQSLEVNYYSNPAEAFAGLVAAYDPMVTEAGGLSNTYAGPLGPLNSASDDCVTGGANINDMSTWQVWNNYTLDPARGPQGEYWGVNFKGVSRSNIILSKLDNVPGLDDATKSRYRAEAQFLRAHYYFDLVRLFKNVPLFTKPIAPTEAYDQPQVAPEVIYKLVEDDLKAAIPSLPQTIPAAENGRATKGAAIALLGKVYLYQQKWADAAAQLAMVNGTTPGQASAMGYKLQANYGQIFSVDNKFNSESVFEIPHSGGQGYTWNNWGAFKSNVYVQMIGARSWNGPVYLQGWGFCPVTKNLVDAFKAENDPRYGVTVINMDSLATKTGSSYTPSYENTGYFINKYAPLIKNKGASGTTELNFPNNYIEIRLADTYLMEAEALVKSGANTARAKALLNAVRARVGLSEREPTLDNIYKERRLELATEGHRWFDLVRTGQAPTVLGADGFRANKHELLPIPLNELNNTKLKQNPGY